MSELLGSDPRANVQSIVPLARSMLAAGKSLSDVMVAIYGADLPGEAYEFYRAYSDGLNVSIVEMFHPWELVDIANGKSIRGTIDENDWSREQEENAYAQAPRFLPLLQLNDADAVHGEHVVGYDLDALARGETTVLGCAGDVPRQGLQLAVLGRSLLAVIHEWAADRLRMAKFQFESPRNRGAGSLTLDDVANAERIVLQLEQLQARGPQPRSSDRP